MNIKVSLCLVLGIASSIACSANVDVGRTGESRLDSNDNGSTGDPSDPGSSTGTGGSSAGCFWDVVLSSSASADGCESDSALQNAAQLACAAKGGAIDAFEGDEACGKGSSQQAKYECCPVQPPPPCFTQTVGNAKQCSSDAELEKLGQSACAAQNAKLVKIDPDEACPSVPPEGASYFATIACCY